ncbi:emp24 domain-containing 1-like [Octopus vulgaris]|uniref:Emp24 domain-containing 1-like n=2 Tax=Octopus TaxID=6643 RepID=A0AA36BHQ9_OCTVU|nr:transmembrane emp24 domain-containing protein 1 [Octopus sinensis]CAI9734279.1 emp24 domain-containing 1-like [Octopus vulgaris]
MSLTLYYKRDGVAASVTCLLCLLLVSVGPLTVAVDTDLTVEIAPGNQECFYQQVLMKGETTLELEYQVIDGGDMDISFYIQGPNNAILVAEERKSESSHKVDVQMTGTYKICFDNTFSRFFRKVVYFDIITENEEDDENGNWTFSKEDAAELMDIKLDDFKSIVGRVKENLERSHQVQTYLKMFEARDRNIQESNFERVNWWSGFQLFLMMSVALTQVFMIRSLFDDHSRLHKVFQARS